MRANRPEWRAELDAGADGVDDIAFSPAHARQLVSASAHRVRTLIWTLRGSESGGPQLTLQAALRPALAGVCSAVFSPNGDLIAHAEKRDG